MDRSDYTDPGLDGPLAVESGDDDRLRLTARLTLGLFIFCVSLLAALGVRYLDVFGKRDDARQRCGACCELASGAPATAPTIPDSKEPAPR